MSAVSQKPILGTAVNNNSPFAFKLTSGWLMNEGGGGVFIDCKGLNNGSNVSLPSPWVRSKRNGHAIRFNNTNNQYINIGTKGFPTTFPLTVMAVINPSSFITGTIKSHSIFDYSSFTLSNQDIFLGVVESTTGTILKIRARCRTAGVPATAADGATDISTYPYAVIFGVYESITSRSCYLNGKLDGTDTGTCTSFPTLNTAALGIYPRNSAYTTDPAAGAVESVFIWNRALTQSEMLQLSAYPYAMMMNYPRRSLQSQGVSSTFQASAQSITTTLTSPTKQVIALSSALSAALSLQTSTISGASNKTVTASPLTVTLSQPSVTLSGSSTTTVNVACLTMTASIQTSVQKGTILPNSLATAMALITATERVTLSPSSFSLIAVLNSVTFGGIQNRTILASALTANFTLFEPIVSQRYRSFLLHTKHNQPRYVNKVNAQRRIAKKNTVSGV